MNLGARWNARRERKRQTNPSCWMGWHQDCYGDNWDGSRCRCKCHHDATQHATPAPSTSRPSEEA